MKSLYTSLLIASLAVGAASRAEAGENTDAKILIHIGPTTTKNQCSQVPAYCQDAVVTGNLNTGYFAYICVGNHSDSVGVAGVQFGITYNGANGQGIDVFGWTLCGDLAFPMPETSLGAGDGWPAANSGTIVTWEKNGNCQPGPAPAVAGYFYIAAYHPDRLAIIPRPNDGFAKVADCITGAEEDLTNESPSALGYADFLTGEGYNPCENIVPVEATTWSGVKSLFR